MSDALAEPMTDADITALIELFDRARLLSAPTSGLASAAVHALRQQRDEIKRLRGMIASLDSPSEAMIAVGGTAIALTYDDDDHLGGVVWEEEAAAVWREMIIWWKRGHRSIICAQSHATSTVLLK